MFYLYLVLVLNANSPPVVSVVEYTSEAKCAAAAAVVRADLIATKKDGQWYGPDIKALKCVAR